VQRRLIDRPVLILRGFVVKNALKVSVVLAVFARIAIRPLDEAGHTHI
jgi:hypothetical protein